SEIIGGKRIPKGKLAFFQERFRDRLYELVVGEFLKREETGLLTKAEVARRIDRKPEQITRWLGAPGNWQLETVSDLLLAIAQAEPVISLVPLKRKRPANRVFRGTRSRGMIGSLTGKLMSQCDGCDGGPWSEATIAAGAIIRQASSSRAEGHRSG
ncbi:MAG TPA: hypothetical protein VN989_11260, partial [Casimicrobiaceae bacterium]|nr:hypothetical protein [Casimicrobiaceae bacterium]